MIYKESDYNRLDAAIVGPTQTVVVIGGRALVIMGRLCGAIGASPEHGMNLIRRLQKSLNRELVLINEKPESIGSAGKTYEVVALPVSCLHEWLISIGPNFKPNSDFKAQVKSYQDDWRNNKSPPIPRIVLDALEYSESTGEYSLLAKSCPASKLQTGPTMSSRDIAALVESRHDSVKRAIERLADRGVIGSPPSVEYRDSLNRAAQEFQISKRDSYVIVVQLSPEFTARLVDRWQELESSNIATLPDFTNPAIAARAWADEVEQKQAALLQLESAKPAVEFVERYVSADSGSKGFRQVAKLLNANEREFRQFLFDKKIMYRLAGEWMPYGNHADAGRFEVKTGVAKNDHAYNGAKFTPKGINWIAGKWAIHNIQEVT